MEKDTVWSLQQTPGGITAQVPGILWGPFYQQQEDFRPFRHQRLVCYWTPGEEERLVLGQHKAGQVFSPSGFNES